MFEFIFGFVFSFIGMKVKCIYDNCNDENEYNEWQKTYKERMKELNMKD